MGAEPAAAPDAGGVDGGRHEETHCSPVSLDFSGAAEVILQVRRLDNVNGSRTAVRKSDRREDGGGDVGFDCACVVGIVFLCIFKAFGGSWPTASAVTASAGRAVTAGVRSPSTGDARYPY